MEIQTKQHSSSYTQSPLKSLKIFFGNCFKNFQELFFGLTDGKKSACLPPKKSDFRLWTLFGLYLPRILNP